MKTYTKATKHKQSFLSTAFGAVAGAAIAAPLVGSAFTVASIAVVGATAGRAIYRNFFMDDLQAKAYETGSYTGSPDALHAAGDILHTASLLDLFSGGDADALPFTIVLFAGIAVIGTATYGVLGGLYDGTMATYHGLNQTPFTAVPPKRDPSKKGLKGLLRVKK